MSKENRFEGLMGAVGKKRNVQTSKHSDVQKSDNEQSATPMKERTNQDSTNTTSKAKSVNPDYVRTTVYLPKKMHKKLKAIAVEEEKEMSGIVEELIKTWLKSRD